MVYYLDLFILKYFLLPPNPLSIVITTHTQKHTTHTHTHTSTLAHTHTHTRRKEGWVDGILNLGLY